MIQPQEEGLFCLGSKQKGKGTDGSKTHFEEGRAHPKYLLSVGNGKERGKVPCFQN